VKRSIEFLLGPSRSGEAFGRYIDGNRGRTDHLATAQSKTQIKRIVVIQGLPIDTQVSLRHTQIRTTFCPVPIGDIPILADNQPRSFVEESNEHVSQLPATPLCQLGLSKGRVE